MTPPLDPAMLEEVQRIAAVESGIARVLMAGGLSQVHALKLAMSVYDHLASTGALADAGLGGGERE